MNKVRLAIAINSRFSGGAGNLRGSFIQMELGHCIEYR